MDQLQQNMLYNIDIWDNTAGGVSNNVTIEFSKIHLLMQLWSYTLKLTFGKKITLNNIFLLFVV